MIIVQEIVIEVVEMEKIMLLDIVLLIQNLCGIRYKQLMLIGILEIVVICRRLRLGTLSLLLKIDISDFYNNVYHIFILKIIYNDNDGY